jgi:hypothetical protein
MEITRVQQYYEFFATLRQTETTVVVGILTCAPVTPGFSEPQRPFLLSF